MMKNKKDFSKYSLSDLDLMYKTIDTPGYMKNCLYQEIERRVRSEKEVIDNAYQELDI